MSLQNLLLGGGVAVALVLSIYAVMHPAKIETVREVIKEQLGSVTGPDRYFDLFVENGVGMGYRAQKMSLAADEACVFKSPTHASSTLVSAVVDLNRASTTVATKIAWYKGATAGATTTIIGNQVALAAAQKFTSHATSTPSQPTVMEFGPGQFLTLALEGSLEAQWLPQGDCSAVFQTARPQ